MQPLKVASFKYLNKKIYRMKLNFMWQQKNNKDT